MCGARSVNSLGMEAEIQLKVKLLRTLEGEANC